MLRRHRVGQTLLMAAGLFVFSLAFRIVDLDVCPVWPLGTHFLWHLLNAALLYAVIRAAVQERQHPLGQELRWAKRNFQSRWSAPVWGAWRLPQRCGVWELMFRSTNKRRGSPASVPASR